ncbi:MAG: 50S ribosomal protein L15 [Chloroflexi bacterium]|nr:50S ribosomal protein L15 [Chloroflexota bacterium]MCL5275629.1 50S ribosomal protein L15 [Chloroflexota bacterium]
MKLHDIKPAPGSHRPKKRKGIGIAAGQGKTSGRGTKGQASRSGGVKKAYFEGGQLPAVRKLPFARGVGFFNPYRIEYAPVNVSVLAEKFAAGAEVNPDALITAGITHTSDKYIAILGAGDIAVPLKVTAHKFSETAKEKIVQAGGSIQEIEIVRGHRRTR